MRPQSETAVGPRVEMPRTERTPPPTRKINPNEQPTTAAAVEKEWTQRPQPSKDGDAARAQSPQQEDRQTRVFSFEDASKRMQRDRHDRAWWTERFSTIIPAGGGYYCLDAGYWYPAFGFDPDNDTYVYAGPIAAIGDLAPDEVVARVQTKLELDGYYAGPTNGVLDEATRVALARFQSDHQLDITSAIDAATLMALGLA